VSPANELFLHDFGLRAIEKFAFECFFDFRIATRNRVADDHTIGRGREMFAFVTVEDVDAELFEHRRHRRIDVQVRAGHVMAARLKHAGQRSHRCSANAD
jgi:hypothetical protein